MHYDKNGDPQLCLVAVSGDMSKNGMGDKNSIYLFNREHLPRVVNYLKCYNDFHYSTYLSNMDLTSDDVQKAVWKSYDAFDELKKLDIFQHKYDYRTEWTLYHYDEDEINQEYGPSYVQNDSKFFKNRKKSYAIMRASKESVLNWFDERGEFEVKILRHKIIYNPFKKQSWLFVRTYDFVGYGEEVELYCMNSEFAECYDAWNSSDFDWKKKALIDCIPE